MLIGTQYYSAYVSLLNTLNFWKIVGGDVIRGYCYNMIRKVGEILYVLLYVHHVLQYIILLCIIHVLYNFSKQKPKVMM